jgi:hypothetical protein
VQNRKTVDTSLCVRKQKYYISCDRLAPVTISPFV